MKLIVERESFLKALKHVQSVVERRNTIPILANVLLETKGEKLSLRSTDLEIEISEQIPAQIAKQGAASVQAHTLYDIVLNLPDGAELQIEASEGKLLLVSGKSNFNLPSLPHEDFPSMPDDKMPVKFSMSAVNLAGLIEKTKFAISTGETRYYLNGIYLHIAEKGAHLCAVATDGHRLARLQLPLPSGAKAMKEIIIPRKTVIELQKLLEGVEEEVRIEVSETRIMVSFANLLILSKLIDGKFPDYNRVIPKENDKLLKISSTALAQGVRRVAAVCNDKTRAVKLSLQKGQLTLGVSNPDSGSASDEMEVEYKAEAIEIGFNVHYLLDVAEQMEGKTVNFAFADSGSPAVITDDEDKTLLYVLMPMRV